MPEVIENGRHMEMLLHFRYALEEIVTVSRVKGRYEWRHFPLHQQSLINIWKKVLALQHSSRERGFSQYQSHGEAC